MTILISDVLMSVHKYFSAEWALINFVVAISGPNSGTSHVLKVQRVLFGANRSTKYYCIKYPHSIRLTPALKLVTIKVFGDKVLQDIKIHRGYSA